MSRKRWARVRSVVDLTRRRASQRRAMSSRSPLSNAWKSASFLASASVSFPVVLLTFVGAGTPSASSRAANFGFDASSASSTLSFASNPSRRSPSSVSASISILRSSSRMGLVYIFRVMSMRRSSELGYPFTSRSSMASHKNTSCLQYSASSLSTCAPSSLSPSVECTARPFSGSPKSVARRARLLPASTPRKARAIDSVSKMKPGAAPYRHERIETSNCALCASTAVRPQSTPATNSGMSHPRTQVMGSSLPYSCTQIPNALNRGSRMYSSVVIFDRVYSLLSQRVSKSTARMRS